MPPCKRCPGAELREGLDADDTKDKPRTSTRLSDVYKYLQDTAAECSESRRAALQQLRFERSALDAMVEGATKEIVKPLQAEQDSNCGFHKRQRGVPC